MDLKKGRHNLDAGEVQGGVVVQDDEGLDGDAGRGCGCKARKGVGWWLPLERGWRVVGLHRELQVLMAYAGQIRNL